MLDSIELERADPERFRELINQLIIFYQSSLNEVVTRVDQGTRDSLVYEFRKQGGRWRVGSQAEGDLLSLDVAVRLDRVLDDAK